MKKIEERRTPDNAEQRPQPSGMRPVYGSRTYRPPQQDDYPAHSEQQREQYQQYQQQYQQQQQWDYPERRNSQRLEPETGKGHSNIPFMIVFILMIIFFFAWVYKPTTPEKPANVKPAPKAAANDYKTTERETERTTTTTKAAPTSADVGTYIAKLSDGGGIKSEAGVTFDFSEVQEFPEANTDAGERKIGIYTVIENGSDETFRVDPYDFKVKTTNGEIRDETYISIMLDEIKDLRDVKLAPGGKTEGYLAFDVPEDDYSFSLLYYDNVFWDDEPAFELKLYE